MSSLLTSDARVWSLEEAFEYCRRLTTTHYENFTVGSLLLPKAKRQHVFDSQVPGLCVRVSQGGKKTFTIVIRINGKQVWRAVGAYGVLSLSDAREKAREGLKRLAEGEREPFPKPEPGPETFEAICRIDSTRS